MCRGEAGISPVFGLNVKCFLSNPLTASVYGKFPVKFHSTVPVFLLPLLFIDVIFYSSGSFNFFFQSVLVE